ARGNRDNCLLDIFIKARKHGNYYRMTKLPNSKFTRRSFLLTSAGLAAARYAQVITAGQIIERIKANVGIPWRAQTVDNIITGTAETPVKGIATTMMATLDVVKRA